MVYLLTFWAVMKKTSLFEKKGKDTLALLNIKHILRLWGMRRLVPRLPFPQPWSFGQRNRERCEIPTMRIWDRAYSGLKSIMAPGMYFTHLRLLLGQGPHLRLIVPVPGCLFCPGFPGLSCLSAIIPFICWAKALVSSLSSQYLLLACWESSQSPQWWDAIVCHCHHHVNPQGQVVLTLHQTQ